MSVVVTDDRPASGSVTAAAPGGAARLAHAMATLAAAEQRTGVRRARAARVPAASACPTAVPLPASRQPIADRPAGLHRGGRAAREGLVPVLEPLLEPLLDDVPVPEDSPSASGPVLVPVPGEGTPSPGRSLRREVELPRQHERHLPVHPDLAGLLPGGVLPAGGVLAVLGSTSLLLGLLGTASKEGAWTAFVGAPALGMLAAADAGLELDRVALVPEPGPDAPTVVAALLDGVDVVVLGPQVALLDSDRRRLAARARERGAVLATTSPWPGAHVSLDARGGSWSGVDHGAGWLRRRTLSVLRTGRGAAARPVELDVEVPVVAAAVPAGLAVPTGAAARRGGTGSATTPLAPGGPVPPGVLPAVAAKVPPGVLPEAVAEVPADGQGARLQVVA